MTKHLANPPNEMPSSPRCGTSIKQQRLVMLDFLEKIDQCADIDSMFVALDRATHQLGYDGIAYTYIPTVISESLDAMSPVFKLSDGYNPDFISHYADAAFAENDFTIKRIAEGHKLPINWWQEARAKSISAQEQHIIEVARDDYHLRHGVTIPTHYQEDGIAGISVVSQDNDAHFSQLYSETLNSLCDLSKLFNAKVMMSVDSKACFYLPFLQSLSYTQQQVLSHLAAGVNLKRVADKLDINYKYAHHVVKQLREKFGNVSRERLMYLAGLMRFNELVR